MHVALLTINNKLRIFTSMLTQTLVLIKQDGVIVVLVYLTIIQS